MSAADRLSAIQIARAVAALLVVGDHAVAAGGRAFGPQMVAPGNIAVFGATGVDLFFVISGFVMALTLARHPDGLDPVRFLRGRVDRLWPMFALAGAALLLVDPNAAGSAWQSIVHSVTILPVADGAVYHKPAMYVGWTLGFECCFYALVAASAARWRGREAVGVLLALTTIAAVAGTLMTPGWAVLRVAINPLQAEFALGIMLWWACDRGWVARHGATAAALGLALFAVGFGAGIALPATAHFADAVAGTSGVARTIDWGLPWSLLLAGLIAWAPTGLTARLFERVGDASYSLYLTHVFAIAAVERACQVGWIRHAGIATALAMVASLALGMAVHRVIECRLNSRGTVKLGAAVRHGSVLSPTAP